jgi:spore maturation protein CgeB
MNTLYISQGNEGSTSQFRGDIIRSLTNNDYDEISYFNLFWNSNFLFKRLAWRIYFGPVISKINNYVVNSLLSKGKFYSVIWIDKSVFLTPSTIKILRENCKFLIHYTPDTAFISNNSRHFRNSVKYFDFVITTKTFEMDIYKKYCDSSKVICISQGYYKNIHFSYFPFESKEFSITFIGLFEEYRASIIASLLNHGFSVYLGGVGWDSFCLKNRSNRLVFLGREVNGASYAKAISKSHFALGLLSKNFPELHTTRTFEIPACGTCLITERNLEIDSFFLDTECIKFSSVNEILESLMYFKTNLHELKKLTEAGFNRIVRDERDYFSQISSLFRKLCVD